MSAAGQFFSMFSSLFAGINLQTVNCKVTWEGTYQFTYEVDYGGGGICNSSGSAVVACQEPGSVYVDNQVFTMYFGKCPVVSTSMNLSTSAINVTLK
jgi:hypothetical protein